MLSWRLTRIRGAACRVPLCGGDGARANPMIAGVARALEISKCDLLAGLVIICDDREIIKSRASLIVSVGLPR